MVDGKIHVMGGANGLTKLEAYDPATDTWTQKANMLRERILSSASVVNRKIYVVGGNTSLNGDSQAFVEEYDPVTDTWMEKASMPTPRDTLSTSVVDGKIYAIGGTAWESKTKSGKTLDTVEEYDPATDTWTSRAGMPGGMTLAGAGTVDGKIYVLGGMTEALGNVSSAVLGYDSTTDTWTRKANMPAPRTWSATAVDNGRIYVFGGADDNDAPACSTLFAYDPATDTWTERDDMPFERWTMSASLVDGKVYLIGGSTNPYPLRPYLRDVWEYDLGAAE